MAVKTKTMDAKKKADALIERFKKYVNDQTQTSYDYNKEEQIKNATQCAIIAAEEVIRAIYMEYPTEEENRQTQHWQQVLSILKSKQ